MGRAVSITDIRVLSELYPGVAAARAVVSGGFVNVHIVPTGGGMPTSQLKSDLQDYLDGIKAAGTPLVVKDPILVPIKITGVIVYKPTFNPDDIETGTEEAIAEFFDPESQYIAFGRSIYLSDILALLDGLVVNNLAAIDHVSFSVCTRDPSPRLLIWTGDAVFSNFVISGTTIDETWTVVFTSPTTFSVTGSVSGLQAATGTVGVQYTTDNDELSFLLSNSGSPMAPADKATIKVSEPFGDVELDEDEFPTIGTLTFSYVKADA